MVSAAFEGMRMLDRQRLVHLALQAELASGAIHSLQLRTWTPEQWRARAARGYLAWVDDRLRAAVPAVEHLDIKDCTNGHAIEGFLDGSGRALDPNGLELELTVVSQAFRDMRPLARQRLVSEALGPELVSGKIHALPRMKAWTPEQWQAKRAAAPAGESESAAAPEEKKDDGSQQSKRRRDDAGEMSCACAELTANL
jgi:acid stress-induced BolA-like protein IbaG/YrbA